MYNDVRLITMPDGKTYTLGHSDNTLYEVLKNYCGYDFADYIRDIIESYEVICKDLEDEVNTLSCQLDNEEQVSSNLDTKLWLVKESLKDIKLSADGQEQRVNHILNLID